MEILRRVRGGKGSNQAVAAARAGGLTAFVGAVGGDAFGDGAAAFLTGEGIRHHLLQMADHPTGTAGITVDAVRTPSAVGLLAPPQNLRLEYTGMSGELLLRFKGESNTRNYSVECSLSAEGPWIDKGLSTTQRVVLDSLIPGKNYWARVCANGSAGASEWSVPTTIMAV